MPVTAEQFAGLESRVNEVDAVIRGLKTAATVLGISGAVILTGLVWAGKKAADAADTASNAEKKAGNLTADISTASTQGVSRIGSATQQAEKQMDDYLASAMARAGVVPIGAVVPFFLSPASVAALAPNWLPANGQRVDDHASPLNGKTLPDLTERFVLGGKVAQDVLDNAANTGGSSSYSFTALPLADQDFVDENGNPGVQGAKPRFVIDTFGDERLKANHQHRIQATNVIPPYRRLVFLVRVR